MRHGSKAFREWFYNSGYGGLNRKPQQHHKNIWDSALRFALDECRKIDSDDSDKAFIAIQKGLNQ